MLATKEKKCMSTKRGRTVNKNTLIKEKQTQKLQGGGVVKGLTNEVLSPLVVETRVATYWS